MRLCRAVHIVGPSRQSGVCSSTAELRLPRRQIPFFRFILHTQIYSPSSYRPPRVAVSSTSSSSSNMTILQTPAGDGSPSVDLEIRQGKLLVRGSPLLLDVPPNVALKKINGVRGAFLGATSFHERSHHHVFPLGTLRDVRFVCCFRFKLWWMAQRMGKSGGEVPSETQFLLVETRSPTPPYHDDDDDVIAMNAGGLRPEDQHAMTMTIYTVFLPVLDGPFRASLQGNTADDQLQICLESGDPSVEGNGGSHSLFLHSGNDPFQVIEEAVQAVEEHLQTFRRRKQKEMPGILDWFGWCTWNAFYTNVSADGVRKGLTTLSEGGTPARFVIIDDGWQSIATNDEKAVLGVESAKWRLIDIKESMKFLTDDGREAQGGDEVLGLKHVIQEIKGKHGLKYVYMWHAITGYWGGIQTDAAEMIRYDGRRKFPVYSTAVLANDPSMDGDPLTVSGLGLVHPDKLFQFYDELHAYLAGAGVDGVKVDVQSVVETLGAGTGGRVETTRRYQRALEASVAKNLNGHGHGCIACMSHNTDGLYNSQHTPIIRASDDFWPLDPASHTIHVASIAYNTLFLGEFMQPDWDMFQSLHPAGEYHAAARAIGGCPVYVSDKPGQHDFALLKKLVFPDGSILRCELPGRPTRDCLFDDPTRDGKTVLKIWNVNKCTGVIGAFNCQGAGWSKVEKKNVVHDTSPPELSGSVKAEDVNSLATVAPEGWKGDCAIYSHRGGRLVRLSKDATLPITLKVLEYEIFTVSPIKKLTGSGVEFAAIGVLEMLNSGGAIGRVEYGEEEGRVDIELKKGVHGEFGVYASRRPEGCDVNGVKTTEFRYFDGGLVKLRLFPSPEPLLLSFTFPTSP